MNRHLADGVVSRSRTDDGLPRGTGLLAEPTLHSGGSNGRNADQDRFLALLDIMVTQQEAKVLALARNLIPDLCPEDLRNPHDYPLLRASDIFNYEDGILAGLLSARMAIAAEVGIVAATLPVADVDDQPFRD